MNVEETGKYYMFCGYELLQRGHLTQTWQNNDDDKGKPDPATLSQYFDPNFVPVFSADELLQRDFLTQCRVVVNRVFPEFKIKDETWITRTDRDKPQCFFFTLVDDRASWVDQGIATLFLNNKENGLLLNDEFPLTFVTSECALQKVLVETKVTVTEKSLRVAVGCVYEDIH